MPVTNEGHRSGAEVIQCYVAPVGARLSRPVQALKAFAKVHLAPGETAVVDLELGDRSFSYWDPGQPDRAAIERRLHRDHTPTDPAETRARVEPGWRLDVGIYELRIGRSSADLPRTCRVQVADAPEGPATTNHHVTGRSSLGSALTKVARRS